MIPYIDLRAVAKMNMGVKDVETILARKINPKRKTFIAFHAKWVFDPATAWQMRQNMRDTKALHDYLVLNGLKRLINKNNLD